MGASMVKHCLGSGSAASPRDAYASCNPTPRRPMPCSSQQYHHHHHHQPHQTQQSHQSHQHHQHNQRSHPHHHPHHPHSQQLQQLQQLQQRQQLPHRPCHPTHALESYHATRASAATPPRKPSPYDRFRQELQLRSAALPLPFQCQTSATRRERYDSRESTCSSSSSADDELLLAAHHPHHYPYGPHHHGHHLHEKDKDRRRRSSSRRSPAPARSYASTTMSSEDSFYRAHSVVTPASSSSTTSSRRSRVSSPSFGFDDLLPEHYVLEELIGSGTTSKCYRCRRTTDGRAFACKIINKRRLAFDAFQRDEMATQLRQEVDVLRRLDHPNIAKLEESFENDTYILLLMELLDGGELFETIIDRVRFSEADAKSTARSILSAIQYMHAQGIVHRDIKPENLLLAAHASPGKPMVVKIVDFGFASSLDARATMTSFLGTGGYLAPEVLTHQPYTAAVDTWAFGVLLYLMLCGRLPFTTAIQLQPGQRLSSVYRLTFPDKYWRGVSSSARDLLTKLLVVNPSRRLTPAEALKHRWFRSDA